MAAKKSAQGNEQHGKFTPRERPVDDSTAAANPLLRGNVPIAYPTPLKMT
jgi:hypothetical protein